MEYRVLARKYRPQTFADLVGQDVLVRTLTNAFATGRVAHAFLLTGIRGIGKTTTARIIARALNCIGADGKGEATITPCGVCSNCIMIAESRHMDVLEIDAASHTGVDNIRDIIHSVQYLPNSARNKVYIIDEVHMLTGNAFNALLKTLEEPPPHVKFIFATTELRKIPVTILSRCQRFELKRVETEELVKHLKNILAKESILAEEDALTLIADAAGGSVRDSLSLLDQAIAHNSDVKEKIKVQDVRDMLGVNDKSQLFALLEKLCAGEINESLAEFRKIYAAGADPALLLQDLLALVHFVTRMKITQSSINDLTFSEDERNFAVKLAEKLSIPILTKFWQILFKGVQEARLAPDPAASAEMTLVRIAYSSDLPAPSDLIRTLKKNESIASRGNGQASSHPTQRPPVSLITVNQVASAPPVTQPQPEIAISSFLDAVEMFKARREPILYNYLMRNVRLVCFEQGKIEINADAEVPLDFAGKVGKHLSDWTMKRWVIILSHTEGKRPLYAEIEATEAKENEDVKSHPLVAAVLDQFPGAEVARIIKE